MTDERPLLFLTEADVRQAIDMETALELAERGLLAEARGEVVGDKFYLPLGEHSFVKPFAGHLRGDEYAFVKTFSFTGEATRSRTASTVLLIEVATGRTACAMEADWITGLKTGASTALTAHKLARPNASVVTIFGAGMQGRMHVRGIARRMSLNRIYLIDTHREASDEAVKELGSEVGVPLEAIDLADRQSVVSESDILITVTTGDQPLIEGQWLKPGVFVAKLGSYQELALDVITLADKVIVDRWIYVEPRVPELQLLQGEFGFRHVYAEWPDVAAGYRSGRIKHDEIIVYLALGIWGEYAAILPEVYRRAIELGLGQRLGGAEMVRET